MIDRVELLEFLKLAQQDCRAEASLSWERQKLFLFLSIGITVAVTVAAPAERALEACLALAFAGLTALIGALVTLRGQTRGEAARAKLEAIQERLASTDASAPGQPVATQQQSLFDYFRSAEVFAALFLMIAALDLVLAFVWDQ